MGGNPPQSPGRTSRRGDVSEVCANFRKVALVAAAQARALASRGSAVWGFGGARLAVSFGANGEMHSTIVDDTRLGGGAIYFKTGGGGVIYVCRGGGVVHVSRPGERQGSNCPPESSTGFPPGLCLICRCIPKIPAVSSLRRLIAAGSGVPRCSRMEPSGHHGLAGARRAVHQHTCSGKTPVWGHKSRSCGFEASQCGFLGAVFHLHSFQASFFLQNL